MTRERNNMARAIGLYAQGVEWLAPLTQIKVDRTQKCERNNAQRCRLSQGSFSPYPAPSCMALAVLLPGRVKTAQLRSNMIVGPVVILLALIGAIAIGVWTVQWLSPERGGPTPREILDARFAKGEIEKAEYEEKRRLISERQ